MPKTYDSLAEFQRDYQYDLSNPNMHLGEGSYAIVVRAFDNQHNKWVALKIGKDLMQEYEAAKNLNHRNIANYEACYHINDRNIGPRDYAVMQLYQEGSLRVLLQKTTLLETQKKELVRGILEGLQYLHAQKRIHRDLKPGNILITQLPNGNYRPQITDFGLTKLVNQNDYIDGSDVQLSDGRGTASYKAPEQIVGETAHYNLDLWAFGVILYEIITGERPFKRGTEGSDKQRDTELERQIKNVALPPNLLSVPQPYQAMIRRCLVKDIHQRVRKASELLQMLDENEPKTDEPAPIKPPPAKPTPPKPTPEPTPKPAGLPLWGMAAIFGVLLVGGISLRTCSTKQTTPDAGGIAIDSSAVMDSAAAYDPFADQMVLVQGGSFEMGSNEGEGYEKPVHRMNVNSFYMGKTEVTQAQWVALMDSNYSHFKGCDNCPVEQVSWNDAQAFIEKLNAQTGKTYRLPTEAEWEYAAGGGSTNRTRFGNGRDILDPEQANFNSSAANKITYSVAGQYRQKTTPVGSFATNALGLYDMSGNVYEWCADWYKGYAGSSGIPDYTNQYRVWRGGGWNFDPQCCRVARRNYNSPSSRSYGVGFRLALSP